MQTIGERLEEARKHKGISVREAAESTKIRGEYLAAFENNSFQIDLPEIYIRGFLRNYANFLKLNGTRILTDYDGLSGGESQHTAKSATQENQTESYGRLELGHSTGPSTESTAAAVAREQEEGQERRRESAFTSAEGRDKAFYIKVGATIVATLVLVAAAIAIVFAIIGSDSPEAATDEPGEGINELFLIGRGNIDQVRVTEIETGETIYEGSIAEGGRIALRRRGPVNIFVSHREYLRIEEDGRGGNTPGVGEGRARWEGWPE